MDLVERYWQLLKDAGWKVLNYRENQNPSEDWAYVALVLDIDLNTTFPFVPAGSQTVRIVGKEKSWFFIYAHANTPDHGIWGVRENVFNQIRGQETINWANVFLKERETEGWWAEPENVGQLIRRHDWKLNSEGNYLVNYPKGIGGCVPLHSKSDVLKLVDEFALRSPVPYSSG